MGGIGFTQQRNRLIDYSFPATFTTLAILIPKPTLSESINHIITAILKPYFETQV